MVQVHHPYRFALDNVYTLLAYCRGYIPSIGDIAGSNPVEYRTPDTRLPLMAQAGFPGNRVDNYLNDLAKCK